MKKEAQVKTAGLLTMSLLLTILAPIASATLPPRYLSVPQFQKCLATQDRDGYRAWCMPAIRPRLCPVKSWHRLMSLDASDAVPRCPATSEAGR
jgi:hypothetical protein